MRVISDSSPLIVLAKAGKLDLLQRLYGGVMITPDVFTEVTGAGLSGTEQILRSMFGPGTPSWIQTVSEGGTGPILSSEGWEKGLGAGELSSIRLALEVQADLLLLDDFKGRKAAKDLGLPVVGCVGILYDAYRQKLIPDLGKAYEELLSAGAWLDRRLIESILRKH